MESLEEGVGGKSGKSGGGGRGGEGGKSGGGGRGGEGGKSGGWGWREERKVWRRG